MKVVPLKQPQEPQKEKKQPLKVVPFDPKRKDAERARLMLLGVRLQLQRRPE